jgi:MFS family permease
VKKWGETKVATIGFASSCLGYALLSFIQGPFWIAVTGLMTSFGAGVLRPSLTSELSKEAKANERGRVMGVNQSLQSLAQIMAPVLGTALIGNNLLRYWAWLPATVSGIGFLLKRSRTA